MKTFTSILATTLLALPSALAAGGWTCQSAPEGNRLSYCVYDPVDNAPDGGWPVIISLPGSGARGPASKAKELAGYDAVGKLITHYLSGENKDEAHTMAATKFLTIVPISPEGTRHFWPENVLEILNEVKKKYNVNPHKTHMTGFSMGSRACWRFGVEYPEVLASLAPSAGAAEYPGDGTLTQEAADAVSPKLKNLINLPIRQFAGKYDNTAGTDGPKKTQADLENLGAKDASLEILDTDHMGLSTKPWTDTDLLSWFLKQSNSGSSDSGSSIESSSNATESTSESSTATYSPVSPPASTSDSTSDSNGEDDCEEDGDESAGEEDDCEDDDQMDPAGTDEEDDCEDDDDTYGDEEDEDCDEETDSTSASSGSYGSSSASSDSGSKDTGNSYVDNSNSGSSYSDDTNDSGYSSDASSDDKSTTDGKYKQYNKSLAQEATTDKSLSQEASSDTSGSLEAEVVQPSRRARRGLSSNHSAPVRARQHHAHGSSRMVHRRRAVRFGKAAPHRK